uniref:Uncharacterized protein n=1 Tax=Cyanothece sp. (strain PCC 7425 / ATCC 29141) TaxID=395961 RepID=B8HZ67_CYAP4
MDSNRASQQSDEQLNQVKVEEEQDLELNADDLKDVAGGAIMHDRKGNL